MPEAPQSGLCAPTPKLDAGLKSRISVSGAPVPY
jgi:hypothetical protein